MLFKRKNVVGSGINSAEFLSNRSDTGSQDDSLEYVGEHGGNDAPPMYQEAGGAPVESNSPLGYSVGPITILFLNISMMIGTGIYSTRKLSWQPSR